MSVVSALTFFSSPFSEFLFLRIQTLFFEVDEIDLKIAGEKKSDCYQRKLVKKKVQVDGLKVFLLIPANLEIFLNGADCIDSGISV